MWKNIVEWGQDTDDNMVNVNCMLDKGYKQTHIHTHTHTLSEYVHMKLIACPIQEWLQEHTSLLQYMYTACLVIPAEEVKSYFNIGLMHLLIKQTP
jgi:hypothetical protein